MKGFHIVMNNAPIQTSQDIAIMIEAKGYIVKYLPSYSPELYPIENFGQLLKVLLSEVSFRTLKI